MKEVLIYGALFAAVLGASVPIVNNLFNSLQGSGTQVQEQVTGQITALNDLMNTVGGTGTNTGTN